MLGKQYTFNGTDDPIVMRAKISDFSQVIIDRVKASMDLYGYSMEEISTIQLVVYKVNTISELAKTPYNFHLSELDNSEKDLLVASQRPNISWI